MHEAMFLLQYSSVISSRLLFIAHRPAGEIYQPTFGDSETCPLFPPHRALGRTFVSPFRTDPRGIIGRTISARLRFVEIVGHEISRVSQGAWEMRNIRIWGIRVIWELTLTTEWGFVADNIASGKREDDKVEDTLQRAGSAWWTKSGK